MSAKRRNLPHLERYSRIQAHDLRQNGIHVLQLIHIRSINLTTTLEPTADFSLHTLHYRRILTQQPRTKDQRRSSSISPSKQQRQRITLKLLLRKLILALVLQEVVRHVRLARDVAALSPLLRQRCDHVVQIVHHLERALGQGVSQDRPDFVAFESSQGRAGTYAVKEGPDEEVRFAFR